MEWFCHFCGDVGTFSILIFFGKGQRVFKKWMEFTNFGRMFQLRGVREVPKNFPIVSVSKNAARVVKSSLVILAV